MRFRRSPLLTRTVGLLLLVPTTAAFAVSCTTQSQMKESDRAFLVQAAKTLTGNVQSGNIVGVRAMTIASLAAQFDPIVSMIQAAQPQIQKAVLTVDALYALNAADLKAAQEETQFFCGLPGSSMTVNITIPQLPPGNYALTVVRATGVDRPQTLSMVLQNDPAGSNQWKLAGFFVRPLTIGGHDGVWYWTQAREYAKKKQNWNAYFYFQAAAYLLTPVDFLTSPNLEKLLRETESAQPDGLPGASPMKVTASGQAFDITNLHTDHLSNNLDLVVTYDGVNVGVNVGDPVAARREIAALSTALLAQHPELRQAFYGLWVHANANGKQAFALELPMNQIP
jgi:hypothetical protein